MRVGVWVVLHMGAGAGQSTGGTQWPRRRVPLMPLVLSGRHSIAPACGTPSVPDFDRREAPSIGSTTHFWNLLIGLWKRVGHKTTHLEIEGFRKRTVHFENKV